MNDKELNEYCEAIADEIRSECDDIDSAIDLAHENADGSEHVIYYNKAHAICQRCKIDDGQAFFADCFSDGGKSYDEIACIIAYGEIRARIEARLQILFEGENQ